MYIRRCMKPTSFLKLFSACPVSTAKHCVFRGIRKMTKICRQNSSFLDNLTRITSTLHEDLYTFLIVSRWVLLRMKNGTIRSCKEIKTHILCSITFFRKLCRLGGNVEKHWKAAQATDDNMAHALFFFSHTGMRLDVPTLLYQNSADIRLEIFLIGTACFC